MSLRRYLLACYGITAVLACAAFAALALSMEGRLPIGPIFEGAALTALANVGINIWPWGEPSSRGAKDEAFGPIAARISSSDWWEP